MINFSKIEDHKVSYLFIELQRSVYCSNTAEQFVAIGSRV